MDKQELAVVIGFVIALTVMTFFLGNSIIGYFGLSMHCEDGTCNEICAATTDCDAPELCCDKGNFGICETECENEYILQPEFDIGASEFPMQSPSGKQAILLYSVLITIVIIIGYAYFAKKKKTKK